MDFVQKSFGRTFRTLYKTAESAYPRTLVLMLRCLNNSLVAHALASQRRRHLWHESRGVPLVTGIYTVFLARLQRIAGCRASRTLEGCGAPQEYSKTISQ